MSSQRLALGVLLLLLLMLAPAYWLWGRLQDLAPPPTAPTPTATAAHTVTPAPTVVKVPPGYRLAGVAVGEPESFAVVEASSGTSALYRVDEEVPGLGRLVRIEAERIVVENEAGRFEMWLTPAVTATPRLTATAKGATPAAPAATTPAAPGAGTAPVSTPSAGPGRPAS